MALKCAKRWKSFEKRKKKNIFFGGKDSNTLHKNSTAASNFVSPCRRKIIMPGKNNDKLSKLELNLEKTGQTIISKRKKSRSPFQGLLYSVTTRTSATAGSI